MGRTVEDAKTLLSSTFWRTTQQRLTVYRLENRSEIYEIHCDSPKYLKSDVVFIVCREYGLFQCWVL